MEWRLFILVFLRCGVPSLKETAILLLSDVVADSYEASESMVAAVMSSESNDPQDVRVSESVLLVSTKTSPLLFGWTNMMSICGSVIVWGKGRRGGGTEARRWFGCECCLE